MKTKKRILAFMLAFCMITVSMSTFGYSAQAKEKEPKASEVVIDVTDFGADPTGTADSAVAIQKAIEAAKKVDEPVTISFPKGRYDIYPDKAAERELYISNTVGADQRYKNKKIGILLENMKNVTVDGNGSLFMFHGKMTTFAAIDCENVTFKNYEVNFQVPTVVDITVEKVEGNTATVYVPECYNYEINGTSVKWLSDLSPYTGERYWSGTNSFNYTQVYDMEQRRTWRAGNPLFSGVQSIEDIGNHRLKFTYGSTPNTKAGLCYQMRPTVRDHSGTFFWKCKDVKLQNLDIRFLHGFGMVGQFSENITLDDVDFEVEKSSGRTTAGYADFIQMSGCKGLIDISGCTFSNPHDDPINIHGTFLQVKERIADNQFKVEYRHNETAGFPQFFVGDEVEFMTQGNMIAVENSVAKVTAVEGPTGDAGASESGSGSLTEIIITLDKDMPQEIQAGTHVVENITYTPSVSIKNNVFKETPTRGILCTTRKPVVIEDNIFDGMGMAGIYISNDAQGWYESGPTRDVTIKNNIFTRCQTDAILVEPTNPTVSTTATVHDNMKIIGNTFYLDNKKALNAKSVSNLTFKDNVIYRPEPMKDVTLAVENSETNLEVGTTAVLKVSANAAEYGNKLFRFNGCKNVLIQGNQYDGGLNAGASISNMSDSDVTVKEDIAKVNADSKTNALGKITYVSSDENVLKVSSNGIVTAVSEGTASVSAYFVCGGRKFETDKVTFTVAGGTLGEVPVDVRITAPVEITDTDNVQYKAEVTGKEGVNDKITWSVVDAESGNETEKAVIDENGLLVPKKAGVVEVIATTVNGLQARKLLVIQKAGLELSDAYEVLFSNPDTMRVSGEDQVTIQSYGQGLWDTQTTNNIVVTKKGAENVTATVKMSGKTKAGYEEAGLVFYKDNDNYVALQRKHAGGNPGIKVTNEMSRRPSEDGISDISEEDVYLKLEKTGTTVKGFCSADGLSWTEVRTVTNEQLGNDFKIGLLVGSGGGNQNHPFVFSQLKVDGVHIPLTQKAASSKVEEPKVVYTEAENKLKAEYKVADGVSVLVKWAAADTQDGVYSVLEGMTGEKVIATSLLKDKFVKAAVIPVTASGIAGEIAWTDAVKVTGKGSDAGEVDLKASNAWLKTADITGVTFDSFDTEKLYYFTTASVNQNTVSFDFVAESEKATVLTLVNGKLVDNKVEEMQLVNGRNEIEVTVTAEDKVTKRYYRFVISKTDGTSTALSELSVSGDGIALEKEVYDYFYQAGKVNEAVIHAVAESKETTVKIVSDGKEAKDGKVALHPGKNEVIITVTPKTGSVSGKYILTIKVPKADNANLADVAFGGNVSLDKKFSPDVTAYKGIVTSADLEIHAAAEETDAKIQVTVNGKAQGEMTGAYAGTVKVKEGANQVVVKVVSPDGTTEQEYVYDLEGSAIIYLSDLDWENNSTTGWGTLQKDLEVGGSLPISLKNESGETIVFKKGLGAHADSDIYYNLKGKGYSKFETYVGVDASQGGKGAVQFEVLIDGVSKAKTDVLTSDSPMVKISLEIPADAENLQLRSLKGEVDYNDHADWADAKFFTAFEGAEPEQIDKEALTALIQYAKEQQKNEMYQYVIPVIKKAFEKALAEASEINEKADATQEEVNAAYEELLKMTHYLEFTGNSTSLKLLVDEAKGLNEKLYTEKSWKVLTDALVKAEEVLANENALQEEIETATEHLQEAMKSLVLISVDKAKLQKLVDSSKKYEDAIQDYTSATAEIFSGALANARDVLVKEDATQEEVERAYVQLQNAIFGLRMIPNKDKLEELIQEAEKVEISNYTEESAVVFVAALNRAKVVLEDENATEQEVKAAEKELKAAKKKLVVKADAGTESTDKQTKPEENRSSTVKTGDETPWTALLSMAVVAAAVAVLRKRRRA